MTDNLILQTSKGSTLSKIFRVLFAVGGLIYLIPAIQGLLSSAEITAMVILNGLLGLGLLATALFATKIGDPTEFILSSNFIRTDDATSYTRTAHWNNIDSLSLSRLGIRVTYKSGTSERFRLPFLSNAEFQELEHRLKSETTQRDISFAKKPWWNPF